MITIFKKIVFDSKLAYLLGISLHKCPAPDYVLSINVWGSKMLRYIKFVSTLGF